MRLLPAAAVAVCGRRVLVTDRQQSSAGEQSQGGDEEATGHDRYELSKAVVGMGPASEKTCFRHFWCFWAVCL